MIDHHSAFIQHLRQAGYSATTARKLVFSSLINKEPLAINEIIAELSAIDRASVYRTIALFEQLGIVQRIQSGWKRKIELSDIFHSHHHHLTCTQCGKIVVLHEEARIETAIKSISNRHEFLPTSHQIEIAGICRTCQNINDPELLLRV